MPGAVLSPAFVHGANHRVGNLERVNKIPLMIKCSYERVWGSEGKLAEVGSHLPPHGACVRFVRFHASDLAGPCIHFSNHEHQWTINLDKV